MPEAQLNLAHAVDVPGQRAEVELGRRPRSVPRCRTSATSPAGRGPRRTSGTPITLARRSSGTATATCTRTTKPDGWVRPAVPARRVTTSATGGRPATVPTSTGERRGATRRVGRGRSEVGMSGSEWAAVVAAQVCLVVAGRARGRRSCGSTAPPRDLRSAAADFRAEAEPALDELRAGRARRRLRARPGRRHRHRRRARSSGRVDAASDLAYRTFTNPVVKALAVGTGTTPRRPAAHG